VFLAEVLTAASKTCVIPKVAYIYRVWAHRAPPHFEEVRDYFLQANLVREVFGQQFSVCWQVYAPFLKFDLTKYVEGAVLSDEELRWAHDRLAAFPSAPITAADLRAQHESVNPMGEYLRQ
jgi:hypothetical protein